MDTHSLQTQYEIMRTSILSAFLRTPEAFNPAYAFAWHSRMMPLGLGHDNELAFDSASDISIAKAGIVLATVKQLELAKRFDDLCQIKLPGMIPHLDPKRIHTVLEYLALKGDLSRDVIHALEGHINSPKLRRNFQAEDIRFPG